MKKLDELLDGITEANRHEETAEAKLPVNNIVSCENCFFWERSNFDGQVWGECKGLDKSTEVDIMRQGYEGTETLETFYCKEFKKRN